MVGKNDVIDRFLLVLDFVVASKIPEPLLSLSLLALLLPSFSLLSLSLSLSLSPNC